MYLIKYRILAVTLLLVFDVISLYEKSYAQEALPSSLGEPNLCDNKLSWRAYESAFEALGPENPSLVTESGGKLVVNANLRSVLKPGALARVEIELLTEEFCPAVATLENFTVSIDVELEWAIGLEKLVAYLSSNVELGEAKDFIFLTSIDEKRPSAPYSRYSVSYLTENYIGPIKKATLAMSYDKASETITYYFDGKEVAKEKWSSLYGETPLYFPSVTLPEVPYVAGYRNIHLKAFPVVRYSEVGALATGKIVFSNFKITGEGAPPIDLSVDKIVPLQVIEDVPLVKDKATVIRAFVSLEKAGELEDIPVRATLNFGGDVKTIDATLVQYRNKIYALGDPEILSRFHHYANANDIGRIEGMRSVRGIDAINFDFYPDPLRPKTNPITIKVDVLPTGRFENRDAKPENNSRSQQATVKDFTESRHIVFMRARPIFRDFTKDHFHFHSMAEEQYNWLVALYPFPEDKLNPIYDFDIYRVGGVFASGVFLTQWLSELVTTTTGWSRLELMHMQAELSRIGKLMFPWAWKVVWVLPVGSMGDTDGFSYEPILFEQQSVLLNEDPGRRTTTAHEIAHTLNVRTVGVRHDPDDRPAANGWDPLHIEPDPVYKGAAKISTLDREFVSYMGYGGPHIWSSAPTYLSLLDKLVVGGSDPTLLSVAGIVLESGKTLMYPSLTYQGIPYELKAGEYEAELRRSDDSPIASYSFTAEKITNTETGEKLGEFFMLDFPYPDDTASVVIKREALILTTLTRSPNIPKLEDYSVVSLGEGKFLLKGNLTDADNDLVTGYLGVGEGENFIPLNVEKTEEGLRFEVSEARAGDTLKLVLSDGMNAAEYLITMSQAKVAPEKSPLEKSQIEKSSEELLSAPAAPEQAAEKFLPKMPGCNLGGTLAY